MEMQVSLYSDPDYRLWVMIENARGALLRARGKELAKYGVSPAEAFALFVISDIGEDANPAEISRRISREHNTIMALLSRMERKGLVTKTRSTEKKNGWCVNLTENGMAACRGARRLDSIHAAMSVIAESDKHSLESALRAVFDEALRQQIGLPLFEWNEVNLGDPHV